MPGQTVTELASLPDEGNALYLGSVWRNTFRQVTKQFKDMVNALLVKDVSGEHMSELFRDDKESDGSPITVPPPRTYSFCQS